MTRRGQIGRLLTPSGFIAQILFDAGSYIISRSQGKRCCIKIKSQKEKTKLKNRSLKYCPYSGIHMFALEDWLTARCSYRPNKNMHCVTTQRQVKQHYTEIRFLISISSLFCSRYIYYIIALSSPLV